MSYGEPGAASRFERRFREALARGEDPDYSERTKRNLAQKMAPGPVIEVAPPLGPPKARRRSHAKLSAADVLRAHALYEDGLSLREVAARIWSEYGYASQDSCRHSLHEAFVFADLPLRSRSEAMLESYKAKREAVAA